MKLRMVVMACCLLMAVLEATRVLDPATIGYGVDNEIKIGCGMIFLILGLCTPKIAQFLEPFMPPDPEQRSM